ncbi:MFS general substrate transporter [Viridothelium virens]|uniref:MFS general substrate transporter n=1 Tax=Viridothelium virens TaxID=1048519 RepID=A0A6A6GYL3_VIRVR|nr:MFS general substrate transporter [Viridothelium virens]
MPDSPTDGKRSPSALDETTPLLAVSGAGPTLQPNEEVGVDTNGHLPGIAEQNGNQASSQHKHEEDKPLPTSQIFLLCYARLVEPAAFFCIFPFVNQMIRDTGDIDERDVGFYSGLIESMFSFTQMLVMVFWGKAADKFGRKPVLCYSLFGVTIATAIFGLSQTIWQMILFRCIAGFFAGTVVTVRTMITENSTAKTQARAFSFFSFSGNLGIFFGPLIGGGLARPAKEYPSVFGSIQFFKEYPYALPTFVTGAISLSAAIVSTLFIRETLGAKEDPNAKKESPMSTWEILKYPGVGVVLYIFGHQSLLGLAYTAIIPVFWFEPVYLGGFGFSPRWISIFLALAGFSQSLWLLLVFPPLQHRFGTGGVLRACSIAWPFFMLVYPICNLLLKHDLMVAFWIVAITSLMLGSGVAMSYTATQLAINDISPSPATLGTLNALALALASGIRAVTPAAFSSLYATGVKYQILGGEFIWVIVIIIAIALAIGVRFLPAKAEGKIMKNDDEPS